FCHVFSFPVSPSTAIFPLSLHDALPIYAASAELAAGVAAVAAFGKADVVGGDGVAATGREGFGGGGIDVLAAVVDPSAQIADDGDRKSTRLNSSHVKISYAVFCLKKKTR